MMVQETLLEEEKIENTVRAMTEDSFTVLDFIETFKELYYGGRKRLVERFGQFGEKRKYTVNTYLSNRLDVYSHKPDSLLGPFIQYKQAEFKDYRRATLKERKVFGGSWIAVFKKKRQNKSNTLIVRPS